MHTYCVCVLASTVSADAALPATVKWGAAWSCWVHRKEQGGTWQEGIECKGVAPPAFVLCELGTTRQRGVPSIHVHSEAPDVLLPLSKSAVQVKEYCL